MKGSQKPLSVQEKSALTRNVQSLYIVSSLLTQLGESMTEMMSIVSPNKHDEKVLHRNMKEFIELKKQMVSAMKRDRNTLVRNEQEGKTSEDVLSEAKSNVQEVAHTNKPSEVISRLRFVPPSMTFTENLMLCMLIGKLILIWLKS